MAPSSTFITIISSFGAPIQATRRGGGGGFPMIVRPINIRGQGGHTTSHHSQSSSLIIKDQFIPRTPERLKNDSHNRSMSLDGVPCPKRQEVPLKERRHHLRKPKMKPHLGCMRTQGEAVPHSFRQSSAIRALVIQGNATRSEHLSNWGDKIAKGKTGCWQGDEVSKANPNCHQGVGDPENGSNCKCS